MPKARHSCMLQQVEAVAMSEGDEQWRKKRELSRSEHPVSLADRNARASTAPKAQFTRNLSSPAIAILL